MKYLLAVLLCLLFTGCDDDRVETPKPPVQPTAAQVENEKEQAKLDRLKKEADEETNKLKKAEKELEVLRLERDIAQRKIAETEARMETKEKDIQALKLAAVQTKLYVGAVALVGIAVILAALAFYFKSAHMAYAAVATGGLAGLVAFAGFLTPWALEIGIGAAILFISFLLYLLFGRDKALFQVTKAVNEIKGKVPGYKEIFAKHIDDAQDTIIDATRKRWRDPEV